MAKYKVLVTARSFGTADSKALELLEANDCEVKKLVAADGSDPGAVKERAAGGRRCHRRPGGL